MNLHERAAEVARLAAKASKGSYTTEAVMDNFFTDICLVDEIPGEGSPQVIATCLCDESDLADVKQATSNARFFAAAPRMAALIAEMDARIRELEAQLIESDKAIDAFWNAGAPLNFYGEEWFIAELTDGSRVVLTALPDEFGYDFKTADGTYFKAKTITRWMQFPDSEYKKFAARKEQTT